MKKIIAIILVLTLAIGAFAGCSSVKSDFTGTTAEILGKINEKVETEVLTIEGNVFDRGLPTYGFSDYTEDEFKKLVVAGDFTENALSSRYHHIIVMKFANSSDAIKYKESIAKTIKDFQYVCGSPESYYVNDSAEYVFIAVTYSDFVDQYAKAFEEQAGTFGKAISGNIE